jgi:hypothetical protein
MRRRVLVLMLVVVTLPIAVGTGIVIAGSAEHSRSATKAGGGPMIAAQANGGGCRFGYDTQTATLIPPDDSTSDNAPANTVSIRKPCQGAVVGLWVGEVSTSAAGDFIHMDMRATCTGTGGLTNPCTVGVQVFASPGHTFVKNTQSGIQTHSAQMMWTGLRRGIWRFEVLPGGNNSASVQFRSFSIQAFNGG